MHILLHSLAAASVAALLAGAGPTFAHAVGTSTSHPCQTSKIGGAIILAEQEMKSETATKPNRKAVMLKGYDPVAYFKQDRAVKGKPSLTSTYHGVTYLFASRADKAAFDKNPAKFEPQYGGFCANSMSKGKLKDIDPSVFYIYKGKLYVCESSAGVNEFRRNPDTNIARADKNWLKIGPNTYNTETMSFERAWPFGPQSNQ